MSFKPKQKITPFAQIGNSTDYYVSQRPNTYTSDWVAEIPVGQNGYQFAGTGYIFGYVADVSGSGSQQLMALTIANSTEPQSSWGKLDYGATMRSACDDGFYAYDNNTEIFVKNKLSSATTHFGQNTRINVIRMES